MILVFNARLCKQDVTRDVVPNRTVCHEHKIIPFVFIMRVNSAVVAELLPSTLSANLCHVKIFDTAKR
jgi:hypothetical protein